MNNVPILGACPELTASARKRYHPRFFHPLAVFFRIQHRRSFLIPIGIWLAAAVSALGIDYSVPYVRDGLPYAGYGGFGAIVGELEVRDITSTNYNGIDGFSGHTQSLIAPPDGDPLRSFIGFQDVKDFTSLNDPTDKNFHGTFVAGIMASEAELVTSSGTTSMMGVAPWARYYGAVFDGAGSCSALLSLNNSLAYLTGTAGASVINCSWGSEETDAANLNGSSYATSLLLDEYAGYSGKSGGTTGKYLDKLIVVSAGNSGTTSGLLGAPADAYNVLTVGALDVVNPNASDLLDPTRSPTAKVAAYSSWRPLANGRAGVDVVAPGTNIWSTLSINYTGTNGLIAGTADGTSFAAPHVTGVAAVLYGAASGAGLLQTGSDSYAMVTYSGLQTQKGTALSTDHKLIKAIIINSADKIAGLDENGNAQSTWQPGKVVMTNGVPNAVVPLNYAVGAGSVNAYKAVQQYDEQGNNFWDLGDMRVTGGDTYYTFGVGKFVPNSADQVFLTGLTATLVWDRHVDYSVDPTGTTYGEVTKDLLSNLDLILQREVSPGVWEDVYMSAGDNSNVEHIYYSPVITGTQVVNYRLEVHATSLAEPDTGETYAIVVSYETSAVPEPATWVLILVAAAGWKLRQLRWKTKLPPGQCA